MSEIRNTTAHASVGGLASVDARCRRVAGTHRATLDRLLPVASPVILLVAWEAACRAVLIDTRFFPPPSRILEVSWQMVQPTAQFPTGELLAHLAISLQRIAIGFCVGAVPGVVLGIAVGLLPVVRAIVQPLVDATFPIPKIAVLPLFIMTFGIGEVSKYAIIAVAVVYLVLINTAAGVRSIDRIYLDVGKSYQASRLMMFTDIALPGALPMIIAGFRLGMGVALLVIVAAEFVGAKSGIGYLIWTSWQVFQVEKMYVGLIVVAAVGYTTAVVLRQLEHRLIPWKRD
jgi:ABC-type nitrate/sulfonate/bicarbonate transport system permease component